MKFGKPSVLGIVTGMVAGLGTITPASGFVGPVGALVIGLAGRHRVFLGDAVHQAAACRSTTRWTSFPCTASAGFIGMLLTGRVWRGGCSAASASPTAAASLRTVRRAGHRRAARRWSGPRRVTWLILKLVGAGIARCGSPPTRRPKVSTSCLHEERGYNL